MTKIYTTREGKTWVVTECAPLPMHPGFFLGFRHTDGQQVLVHEHRCRDVEGEDAGTRGRGDAGREGKAV